MNAKSNNFKASSSALTTEMSSAVGDTLLPPKTPIKKLPHELAVNISATLSPLICPPKLENRVGESHFIPFPEMCVVETPLPRENSRFLPEQEQDAMDYTIGNRIIFESSGEDNLNNSSESDSSESPEQDLSSSRLNENPEAEQGGSSESSEQLDSDHDIQENGVQGGQKVKRSSKSRGMNSGSKDAGKKVVCNCKKTKCLKLYCDCFRLNQTCDGCNCVGCHNLETYYQQRNNAIMALMDRNPDPFGQKIEDDKHVKGCNCKKSNCLKKYCQCYQAGLKCGENCKCEECKNVPLDKNNFDGADKGASKNTAKKERRMVQI